MTLASLEGLGIMRNSSVISQITQISNSLFSATVAVFGDSHRFRRQCGQGLMRQSSADQAYVEKIKKTVFNWCLKQSKGRSGDFK